MATNSKEVSRPGRKADLRERLLGTGYLYLAEDLLDLLGQTVIGEGWLDDVADGERELTTTGEIIANDDRTDLRTRKLEIEQQRLTLGTRGGGGDG